MRSKRNKRQSNHSEIKKLNYTKIFVLVLIFLLILFSIALILKNFTKNNYNGNSEIASVENSNSDNSDNSNNASNSSEELYSEKLNSYNQSTTINIAFTGDIMCHNTMYNDAYDSSSGNYDFSYLFQNIKYYLQTPDLTVGNLETTFAGSTIGYSSYPTFNTPEILAKNLKKVGFDVVSTANNHCMDKKYAGLESTIKYLDEADLAHTGTYTSEENKNTILVQNVKGIKIAFLSFTYGTNGISVPNDKKYAVNFLDEDTILSQISLAKDQEPDIVCALVHWGVEYQTIPNANQKQIANLLIDNGVNLIIGNHPHVPQPLKFQKNNNDEDVFIAYSLGNFMADQNKTYTRDSLILNLTITKNNESNEITIDNYDYTPIYFYKNPYLKTQKFSILDMSSVIEAYDAGYDISIGQSMYNKIKEELLNIKNIIEKEI